MKYSKSFGAIISLQIIITLMIFKSIFSVVAPSSVINLIAILCLAALFFASLTQKSLNYERAILLALLVMIFLNSIMSLIAPSEGVLTRFTIMSSVQMLFPFVFLYVLLSLKITSLSVLYRYVRAIVFFLCVVAVIEGVLIPVELRNLIAMYFLDAKLGEGASLVAHTDIIFGYSWPRSGSLLFEPLSFATVAVILFVSEISSQKKSKFWKKLIFFLGLLFAAVKSAFITLIMAFNVGVFGVFGLPLLLLGIVIFMFLSPGVIVDLFAGDRVEGMESISNHIIGLFLGFFNTLEAPWMGHGLGSSGYLIWLEAKNMGISGPFLNDTGTLGGLANGNESALGVIVYQMGFPFVIALLFFMAKIFLCFARSGERLMAGAVIGFFIFLSLSESALAFSAQVVVLTVFVYRYRLLSNLYLNENDVPPF